MGGELRRVGEMVSLGSSVIRRTVPLRVIRSWVILVGMDVMEGCHVVG